MSKTNIEWCARPGTLPEVWNVVTGCNKVSQGCKNCYAEKMHKRLQVMHPGKYSHAFLAGAHTHEDLLSLPLLWKKPRTVFVNSMSDIFHENVDPIFILDVFQTMAQCSHHTFIILTKRPHRMLDFCNQIHFIKKGALKHVPHDTCSYGPLGKPTPLPNVWLGVSVEDQATADERIPLLLQVPAAVRFLSCEPLLGPINLKKGYDIPSNEPPIDGFYTCAIHGSPTCPKVNWVIVGGESGPNARPMNPAWVMAIRDQCKDHGVPFFFKQWGAWKWSGCNADKKNIGPWKDEPWPTVGMDAGDNDGVYVMCKRGKKKAGRSLNGREHLQWPELQ